MKRVTIRDVAREAGVSLGTASRVINAAPNVELEIKTRVLAAIERLGFVPNRAAQEIRKGRSNEIGIIVRDITTPVLAGFVRAVQDVFERAGYVLLISSSDNRKDREMELLRQFQRRHLDALIMTTADETDADLAEARARLPFPVLMFDRDVRGAHDAVLIDHADGIRQAVAHLLELGHRRILLLTGATATYPARSRVEGYVKAYKAAGLQPDMSLVQSTGFDSASGFRGAAEVFGRADRPTAVIAGGIDMLPGVLRALRGLALRVPEDVSVVAGADSDLAQLATPAISALRWNLPEFGMACAHMVLERIDANGSLPSRRVVFPPELVVRASTAAARLSAA